MRLAADAKKGADRSAPFEPSLGCCCAQLLLGWRRVGSLAKPGKLFVTDKPEG